MTRFVDGPAKGQVLMLRRAVMFLRVTEESGKFDGLDQIEDWPTAGEKLYAYEIVGKPGYVFVDGPKCRGRFVIAEYRLVSPQPTDAQMRSVGGWHDWVMATAKARGLPTTNYELPTTE